MARRKIAFWIRNQVDFRHYHYICSHCRSVSKYRKSPYCAYCGFKMRDKAISPDEFETMRQKNRFLLNKVGKSV